MTEREKSVLLVLRRWELDAHRYGWDRMARPMDIGGSSGSHHSSTLNRLVSKGLVVRRRRVSWDGPRGSYRYGLTHEGVQALRASMHPETIP